MKPTIVVTLKLGQPIQAEVKNVQGGGCKALTRPLEALGQVEQFTPKPEYYDQSVAQTNTINQSL